MFKDPILRLCREVGEMIQASRNKEGKAGREKNTVIHDHVTFFSSLQFHYFLRLVSCCFFPDQEGLFSRSPALMKLSVSLK